MAAQTSTIGTLLAPWNVEQAVIAVLGDWLDYYVYDVERQNDVRPGTLPRPPAPESVQGGLDFESWQEDLLPMVIVVCNPVGDAELNGSVGYSQTYQVDIGAFVDGDDEAMARQYAGLYAAATAGAVLQHGSLGGLATRSRLMSAPRVSMPDPEIRRLALGECTFHVEIDAVANETGAPADPQPPADPSVPPGPWPTVQTPAAITVTALAVTEQLP